MKQQHSKGLRKNRLHYGICPKCKKRFSDLDAHYRAIHLKADQKMLKEWRMQ